MPNPSPRKTAPKHPVNTGFSDSPIRVNKATSRFLIVCDTAGGAADAAVPD